MSAAWRTTPPTASEIPGGSVLAPPAMLSRRSHIPPTPFDLLTFMDMEIPFSFFPPRREAAEGKFQLQPPRPELSGVLPEGIAPALRSDRTAGCSSGPEGPE